MKIAALGDSHVGRSAYPIASAGVNVRERDFEETFLRAVDLVLGENPDLIVFLGDIFDFPRPSFRSFRVVQRGLFALAAAGVPVVAISGNHDTPRLRGTESPYAALHDVFPQFSLVYRQEYEYFDVQDVRVHAIPQMMAESETLVALAKATANKSVDRVNLVITHPRISQLTPNYSDINEIEIDAEAIRGDLVLLGHYHIHIPVKEAMWYVGSTDTFSFGDSPNSPKGFVMLDTNDGSVRQVPLSGRREMIDRGFLNVVGHGPSELESVIFQNLEGTSKGAVVRIRLDGVDPAAFRMLDQVSIREVSKHLLHLRIEPLYLSSAIRVDLPKLESMGARWQRYVDTQDLPERAKRAVSDLGIEYIHKAIEAS